MGTGTRNDLSSSQLVVSTSPHAVFRKLSGLSGGVVLHLKTTAYYRLNETGAAIWQHLQDPITAAELVRRMEQQFDDVPQDLDVVIRTFIADLTRRDLLQTVRQIG